MTKKIQRNNWTSKFELVGKPKINDYTFKLDSKSEKSAWIYSSMSLYVDCGEKYGDILCEMMGGYSSEGNSVIYAHGKDENGRDDFTVENRINVAWEDRFDESILESVGSLCFFTVGLEKDKSGKTFYKEFLSEYDAIAYIQEHLSEDMVIRVKGDLVYSLYDNNVMVKKKVRSIVLSKVEDSKDFSATFTQSILLDKDSFNIKDLDKSTGDLPIYARVLDYVKEINGTDIRTFYPMPRVFYYKFDLENPDMSTKFCNRLLKVKNGITQINFCGELIENGTVTVSYDDLPDEIKELIEIGAYSKEEALSKCSDNKSKDKKMYITKPNFVNVELKDGTFTPTVMMFENAYTEEDLFFEIAEPTEDTNEDVTTSNNTETQTNTMDWLNNLV